MRHRGALDVRKNAMESTLRLTHQPLGAQLLQATSAQGDALFYLSPRVSVPQGSSQTPARGGVPVLFPQFADCGPLPKHGWVRNHPWTLQNELNTQTQHTVRYHLHLDPATHPAWPHTCDVLLSMHAGANTLAMCLTVHNTGAQPLQWTGGLHPYFAVDDLSDCELLGLGGLGLQDRYHAEHTTQAMGALTFEPQPLECLFDTAPSLALVTRRHTVHLSTTGFDQWMVWNPGPAGAVNLPDLPDDDWQRFVCVEPVRVTRPVTLAAGEHFVGQLFIKITPNNAA